MLEKAQLGVRNKQGPWIEQFIEAVSIPGKCRKNDKMCRN